MRLIDADALKALIIRRRKEAKTLTGIDMVMVIDDAPTVDTAPVVHGKWIMMGGMKPPEYHHHHQCSICESYAPMSPPYGIREMLTPHCPVCNAKMDLEEQDANEKT